MDMMAEAERALAELEALPISEVILLAELVRALGGNSGASFRDAGTGGPAARWIFGEASGVHAVASREGLMGARKPRTPEQELERSRGALEMERSVEQMAANGLTPQEISLLTGLKAERLYKRYKDSMMKGGAKRTNEVAQAAFLMATGGPEKNWRQADASMNKFWLERRGGPIWAPPRPDDERGPDLTRLSVPQLIELERALRPLARHPVMIDAVEVEYTESRPSGAGAIAAGDGDLVAGGVGDDLGGEAEVS